MADSLQSSPEGLDRMLEELSTSATFYNELLSERAATEKLVLTSPQQLYIQRPVLATARGQCRCGNLVDDR